MEITTRIPKAKILPRYWRWGLLALPALAAVLAVTLVWPRPGPASAAGNTSPDTGRPGGQFTSLELDAFGYPVVSYYDDTNGDLKVLHCGNAYCTSGNTITSADTVGDVGQFTSLELDAFGKPVVSYYDQTNGDLKVLHCGNVYCSSGNSISSPDTGGDVGQYTSLALDASGYPVVSYYDSANGDLKVLHCGNANCTAGNSITSPDTVGDVGSFASLALDASGNPVVSYFDFDFTQNDLKLLHCNDPDCSGGDETITAPDTAGVVGQWTSLALDASGNPVVSYRDGTNRDLKVLHCGNATCTAGNSITSPDTVGEVGEWTSLALDASGYPVVSYYDATNENLKLLHCNDPNCTGGDETITSPDTGGMVGSYTSLALDSSGNPVVSYHDSTNGDLKVLHCNDTNCADWDSIASPDTGSYVGWWTSLALDSSGYPVVSYMDYTNDDLKVLHCNDADCSGGDESITSPDTGDNVGYYTSLALDSSGYPVVSYHDSTNGDLKVLHCNDAGCSGGDESITSPDTGGDVGQYTSLALDSSGYPVVSYFDGSNGDLKVMHCNDANCSGGDESITSPDTGGWVGRYTWLALDASGDPVVSYYDDTNEDLKLLHCNDANCAGGDESITSPDTGGSVGYYTSLALDSSGYPVVSYYDNTNGDLKVLHCGNANCTSGNTIATADIGGTVGEHTSLALDGSGYPVVSYYGNGDLKVLRCNDANCAGGDESITSPDTDYLVGRYTSLALDGSGYPVVSYLDSSNQELKVLHCGNANCAGKGGPTATPTVTATDTFSPTPTATVTPTATAPVTPTYTYTPTATVTVTPTYTYTPTATAPVTPTFTLTPGPSQINVTNLGQYALPKTCFFVYDQFQNPRFGVCDNDFQGAPDSHPICVPDGVCEDEDPAEGLIRVTVAPGQYSVVESKAPPYHTADPSKLACDTSIGKCELTFASTPDSNPWFPWDVNGDGIVDLFNDIVEVIQHFGQTKP